MKPSEASQQEDLTRQLASPAGAPQKPGRINEAESSSSESSEDEEQPSQVPCPPGWSLLAPEEGVDAYEQICPRHERLQLPADVLNEGPVRSQP